MNQQEYNFKIQALIMRIEQEHKRHQLNLEHLKKEYQFLKRGKVE